MTTRREREQQVVAEGRVVADFGREFLVEFADRRQVVCSRKGRKQDATCGDFVDAKGGAANAAAKADLAELWGFGFIQGYKNVAQADMEIPIAVKPQLLGAVQRSCGNNRATLFMDLTALVADKVKLN